MKVQTHISSTAGRGALADRRGRVRAEVSDARALTSRLRHPHSPTVGRRIRPLCRALMSNDHRIEQAFNSFRAEYERRRNEEAAEVEATVTGPATKVAHIVYATS